MHYTIELLIQGDENVVTYYRKAEELWSQIDKKPEFEKTEFLAKVLTNMQLQFEHECGGRWVGQEIMVVVGITRYYTTDVGFEGNEELALRVHDAFMASFCSMEVKGHAQSVAEAYDLEELRNA